jgi:hypothetical protein
LPADILLVAPRLPGVLEKEAFDRRDLGRGEFDHGGILPPRREKDKTLDFLSKIR